MTDIKETPIEQVKEGIDESSLEAVDSFRGWVVVFGSFLAHFAAIGMMYSYSIFVTTYETEFESSRAVVSLGNTIGLGSFFTIGIFSGRLADMFGVKPVVSIGTVFFCIGLVIASYSNSMIMTIMSHGVITHLGIGLVYFPSVAVVPQWFDKSRAFALGMAVLGAGLGNLAFSFGGQLMIESLGWRTTLQVVAGIGAGLLTVAVLCLKRRLPTEKKGGIFGDMGIIKDRDFQKFCLAAAFFQFGYTVPFVHLAPYIGDLGIDATFAGLCVGLIGAGSALGRITLGWVADKYGRIRVFRVTLIGSAVTCGLWIVCTTEVPLVIFSVFFGYFNGGFLAMFPVIISMYFGVARLGGISGIFNMANIPGALAGAPLAGFVKDSTGSYDIAIVGAAVFILLSAITMYTVGPPPEEEPNTFYESTNPSSTHSSSIVSPVSISSMEEGLPSASAKK